MKTDQALTPVDYLTAELVCDSISRDLEIHFQIEGDTWDREKMQRHINDRAALIRVKSMLLDAGERLLVRKPK